MSRSALQWAYRLDGWALFAFAAGSCFLFGYGQQRSLAILMILSSTVVHLRHLRAAIRRLSPVPPEIWLYTGWVAWAGLTGPLVAADLGMFWAGMRVVLQMFVLVWVAYSILRQIGSPDAIFWGLIVGALVQVGMVFAGAGSIRVAAVLEVDQRVRGSTSNPNGLAFLMVWCTISAMNFWHGRLRWALVRKPVIASIVGLATIVLLASGSRKSTIALAVLLYLWAVVARGTLRGIKKAAAVVVVGVAAFAAITSYGPSLVEDTEVGRRFDQFLMAGHGDVRQAAEANIRYRMYVDGWKMFSEHPVFGVGLNNFGVHFVTGQYSHSNLIEPLATTGLIGFLLYQAFYILVFFRAWRLLRVVRAPLDRYRLRMVLIGIVTINLIGLGSPLYTSSSVHLLLVAFSVFTAGLREQYIANREVAGAPIEARIGRRARRFPGRFPAEAIEEGAGRASSQRHGAVDAVCDGVVPAPRPGRFS